LLDDAIKQFPLHATHEIRCAFIRDLFTSMKLHALFRIIQNNKKFVPKRGEKELEDCLNRMDRIFQPIQNQ
jgi:hypothetical protein